MTAFVLRHQDRVFALLQRLLRDRTAAEELTQDVFLKALHGLREFRGDAKVETWLFRIAVNASRDHRTSRATRMRASETTIEDGESDRQAPADLAAGPERALEEAELFELFHRFLDELADSYRECLVLRHQEGCDYGEIAKILGISRVNAKVRVHRAREMILQRLRDRGYGV